MDLLQFCNLVQKNSLVVFVAFIFLLILENTQHEPNI